MRAVRDPAGDSGRLGPLVLLQPDVAAVRFSLGHELDHERLQGLLEKVGLTGELLSAHLLRPALHFYSLYVHLFSCLLGLARVRVDLYASLEFGPPERGAEVNVEGVNLLALLVAEVQKVRLYLDLALLLLFYQALIYVATAVRV